MTSFLRAWGPFSLMKQEVEIVEAPYFEGWWTNFRYWIGIDVCFLHRPYGHYGACIIEAAKLHGVPLWVDHDDDLLNIPENNPHREVHVTRESICPSIEMSYREADILTCSGKVMHDELRTLYKREDAILITTGLDDRLVRFKKPFSTNRRVGWRGSESHSSDLSAYREPIKSVMDENKDKEWHFFGIDPVELDLVPEGVTPEWYPQLNIFEFYKEFTETNCQFHFVVLEDNHFNRVKSNISWMDATLAGSIVLGPAFEEWSYIETCRYFDGYPFNQSFIDMTSICEIKLEKIHNGCWEYIMDVLLQSKLNEKRYEILRNL